MPHTSLNMPKQLRVLMLALIFIATSSLADAAIIEVNSGNAYTGGGGPGTGRAQGFQALSDFSISSVGIEANLVSQSFDVVIFASTTGSNIGAQLASASATLGGSGFGWYDMSINYAFAASNFYVVDWRPSSSNSSWVNASGGGPGNPGIQYYEDSSLPVTVGPIRLVEGFEGWTPSPGNSLHPSLRYDANTVPVSAVPLPAALPFFLSSLAVLGLIARRRKQAA